MTWPASGDYNEAIQNPASAFADPDLRGGQPAVNPLGLPIPRSGNFADVYELRSAGHKWAVKCFTREVRGLRDRYQEISRHLQRLRLPFMVDFHYLDQGIRIRGQWYPILKMDWVEGLTLNEFVRMSLEKPGWIDTLAQIWLRMAQKLRASRTTHADLQHGNVLLVPGSKASALAVKLIDYDGMLVPSLANRPSGELGHPAYQHPGRLRTALYCPEVDYFPHLVIFCALRALLVGGRPLWDRYDNGDNLLFRQKDLEAPDSSPLFEELLHLPDAQVRQLTTYLRQAAVGPLQQTPWLEKLLPRLAPARGRVPVARGIGKAPPLPEWSAASQETDSGFADWGNRSAAPSRRRRPRPWLLWAAIAGCMALAAGIPGGYYLAQQIGGEPGPELAEASSNAPTTRTIPIEPKPTPQPSPAPAPHATKAPPGNPVATIPSPPPQPAPSPNVARPVSTPPKPAPRQSVPKPAVLADLRLLAPDDDTRAGYLAAIRDRYSKEYARTDPDQSGELARQLLKESEANPNADASYYVVLEEASRLAIVAGNAGIAIKAIDQLGAAFQVDTLGLKVNALIQAAPAVRRPSQARIFLEAACRTADELLSANHYADIARIFGAIDKVLALADWKDANHVVAALTDLSKTLADKWRKVQPAAETLKTAPDNAVACAQLGRFLCLNKGDWPRGLPLLTRGNDPELKSVAVSDLAIPDTVAQRIKLAGRYVAMSEAAADPLAKVQTARRAAHWYRAALATASESEARKISESLRRLDKLPGFRNAELPGTYRRLGSASTPVRQLAVSNDGLFATVAGQDLQPALWDLDAGRQLRQLKRSGGVLVALRFSPAGDKIAGLDPLGNIPLWDRNSGERVDAYRLTRGPVRFFDWLRAGVICTAGTSTWFQRVPPDETGDNYRIAPVPGRPPVAITCMASSSRGDLVAFGTNRGVTEIYTAERPQQLYALPGVSPVHTVAFSADGRHLAVAHEQGPILVWELKRSAVHHVVRKQGPMVEALALSADGKRVLWSTGNDLIHVSDTMRKRDLRLVGHKKPVRGVAFLPDGQHALSASEDGALLLWSLPEERD